MGTNFYLRHDSGYGEIQEIHIAKTSCGWLPLMQISRNINSVKDIKTAYDTGDFIIIDEYDEEYTWEQFEKRVLNHNKDNPKALSHIKPPEHFSYKDIRDCYGGYWTSERFVVDDEGYEFSKDEFS